MEAPIRSALEEVLSGEVGQMALIEAAEPDQLTAAAADAILVLTRDAVARVLRRYSAGQIASTDVQRWASFVRRGYVAGGTGEPVRPLDIGWEPAYETAISEAVSRLDELGDLVDGTIRKGELEDLLDALSAR